MLTPVQEREALKLFISEQIDSTDKNAADFLQGALTAGRVPSQDSIDRRQMVERAFAKAHAAIAQDGADARLPWPKVFGDVSDAEREEVRWPRKFGQGAKPFLDWKGRDNGQGYTQAAQR